MNLTVSPTTFVCPACNAQISKPCTQATDTGRIYVTWHHLARIDLAADATLSSSLDRNGNT